MSTKQIFCIYDTVSGVFGAPALLINELQADRLMRAHLSKDGSDMQMFPSDYIMYCLGSFDPEKGAIVPKVERLFSARDVLDRMKFESEMTLDMEQEYKKAHDIKREHSS